VTYRYITWVLHILLELMHMQRVMNVTKPSHYGPVAAHKLNLLLHVIISY